MFSKIVLSMAMVATCLTISPARAAIFVDESFTVSLDYSSASFLTFENAMAGTGPFIVNGTEFSNGQSLFDTNVSMIVTATETVISPTNSIVEISIFGRDALGNLTNPIANGSLASDNTPFTYISIGLGSQNGGANGLQPAITPYSVNDFTFTLLRTDGGAFETATSFTYENNPPSPGSITGSSFVNVGTDVSSFEFEPGVEIAGARLTFDITVVPEPSTAGMLLLSGMFVRWRQRGLLMSSAATR